MKKNISWVIMVIIVLFISSLTAKSANIAGDWLLEKIEINGKTKEIYQTVEFGKDGKFIIMGMDMATWKHDTEKNEIILNSKIEKDFNGASKIIKFTKDSLVLEKNGAKYYYLRTDKDKISKNNENSGFFGTWKTDFQNMSHTIIFNKPDTFSSVTIESEGVTSNASGKWIYNPKNNTLIIIGFFKELRGKSIVKSISKNTIELVHNNEKITLKKQKQVEKVERLNFKYEDFPEEDNGESLSPWKDFYATLNYLSSVKTIKYKEAKLIEKTKSFEYTTYIEKVNVNNNEEKIIFTKYIIKNGQEEKIWKKTKDSYNDFFPLEEPFPNRLAKTEKITVPAGTFTCTVIEGFNGEDKVKYWMINDKPGIYAKTIVEKFDPFGEPEYYITVLEEIK
jgi:hypothetical protein